MVEPHHDRSPGGARVSTHAVGESAYVVSVEGDLDLYSSPLLLAELEALVSDAPDVVLDLSGSGFVDSTALGVIVGAGRRLREAGGRLALVCPVAEVRSTVELVGVDRVVPVYDDVERALEHLVGAAILRKLDRG